MHEDDIRHVRWRPKLGLKGLLFGLLIGLGLSGLTQQLGWIPFSTTTLILWLVGGVVLGAALASIGHAIGVARINRRLEKREEARTDDREFQQPGDAEETPDPSTGTGGEGSSGGTPR